jgi:hypothetical protein
MKKILFIVASALISCNVFCQTADKEQAKKVKDINRESQKQLTELLKKPAMTEEEKKRQVYVIKNERDARLLRDLTPAQISVVKDPIDWDGTVKRLDKQESAKLKAEKEHILRDIDRDEKDLDSRMDGIKRQMEDLKRQQKDVSYQQKELKQRKKEINTRYK